MVSLGCLVASLSSAALKLCGREEPPMACRRQPWLLPFAIACTCVVTLKSPQPSTLPRVNCASPELVTSFAPVAPAVCHAVPEAALFQVTWLTFQGRSRRSALNTPSLVPYL